MRIKLLFFIVLSFLLSSCYTHFRYVYINEPVDEVYIYDVNYVYTNLWYDDFYWQYDNVYFGLYYYSPRYYQYSYHHYSKPYNNYHNKPYHFQTRDSHRRRNVVNNPHYRHKQSLIGHNVPKNVPVKRVHRTDTSKKRVERNQNSRHNIKNKYFSPNKPKIHQTPKNNLPQVSKGKSLNTTKQTNKKGKR